MQFFVEQDAGEEAVEDVDEDVDGFVGRSEPVSEVADVGILALHGLSVGFALLDRFDSRSLFLVDLNFARLVSDFFDSDGARFEHGLL